MESSIGGYGMWLTTGETRIQMGSGPLPDAMGFNGTCARGKRVLWNIELVCLRGDSPSRNYSCTYIATGSGICIRTAGQGLPIMEDNAKEQQKLDDCPEVNLCKSLN